MRRSSPRLATSLLEQAIAPRLAMSLVNRPCVTLMHMRWTLLLLTSCLWAQSVADLQRGFQHPPDDARIMMRWWWFGPAVQQPELEREMRAMKAGGIGGFEVQPVYPLELEGNFPYLSPPFLDAVKFTGQKA